MKLNYEQLFRVEELSTDDAADLARKVVELEVQRDQLREVLGDLFDFTEYVQSIPEDVLSRIRAALAETGGQDEN